MEEEAPFDVIVVTAGAPSLPQPLVDQLKVGGTMVIPVGDRNSQRLIRIRRDASGFVEEELIECNFVALVGEYGWKKKREVDPLLIGDCRFRIAEFEKIKESAFSIPNPQSTIRNSHPVFPHLPQDFLFVEGEELSVFHDQFSVDDHIPHIRTRSRID